MFGCIWTKVYIFQSEQELDCNSDLIIAYNLADI